MLMTRKLKDHGAQCMFIGYAKDHAGDVYHMWDPNTNRIHETCDIIWLKRMFFKKPNPAFKVVAPVQFNPDDPYNDMEAGDNVEFREGENEDGDKSGIADMDLTNMADEGEEALEDVQEEEGTMTRSGRVITRPARLIKEMVACSYEISLSVAEQEQVL